MISKTEAERPVSVTTMLALLGGRLMTISGFLIFLSFILPRDGIAFYAFIAFAYILTIPYSLWMRNQDRMRQLAPLQFLVDLVFVSGLVYFTSGCGLDFLILLYPLIILSSGIILPLRQTIQITILAIISYALVVLLISQNILVPYTQSGDPEAVTPPPGAILLRIFIFIVFGIASAYVSRRCDYINKKEKQFREITNVIFKNVKTGLLLLDADGRILIANDRACILLGRDEQELTGKALSSIHLKPSEIDHTGEELRGASDYFRRADGSVFPVSIEEANLTLPAEAVPDAATQPDTLVHTRIINFNDLSNFLRLQSRTRQLERIRAAADMAKEMAYQIRSPLTGVSGAVQLFQQTLNPMQAGKPSEAEWQNLSEQIVQESARMEKIIKNFIDYAEFSPSDVRDLIQMDIDRDLQSRTPNRSI